MPITSAALTRGLQAFHAGECVDASGTPISCNPPPINPPEGPGCLAVDGVVVQPWQ